ncbi:hypothetical protein L7F22_025960 [Adiantum nelumboides]|nr:hypothetical protein [Adiantum nelumboides]
MGEPSSSWQNFNFRDDEGSAQGMQALRLLLAKLQEAQANPCLKPSVNNLLMTEDLMLTSTQRLPSSVAPMHLEGGEGVPVMHGPMQANVVPHPLQGPLQTDGAKKKQYHGQKRHVGKIREEGDFHDDDDEPPSRSRHKKRTNERRTKRSRRNSSGGSSSSSQSGRSSHGRFPKKDPTMSEDMKLYFLWPRLHGHLSRRVRDQGPTSYHEAIQIAQRIEATTQADTPPTFIPPPTNTQNRSLLDTPLLPTPMDIDVQNTQYGNRRRLPDRDAQGRPRCYACNGYGHIQRHCGYTPEKHLGEWLMEDTHSHIIASASFSNRLVCTTALQANGIHLEALLDSGSSISSISTHTVSSLNLPLFPAPPISVLFGDNQNTRIVPQEFVLSTRGSKLFTCRWLPRHQSVKALVFLCHGYGMECSVFMNGTGTRLAEAGNGVFGIDYEGHGRSEGRRCYIQSFHDLVNDCVSYCKTIRELEEYRNLPRFLYGESMGGAVALLVHRKEQWTGMELFLWHPSKESKTHPHIESILIKLCSAFATWKIVPTKDVIEAAFKDPNKRQEIRQNPYIYQDRPRLKTALEMLLVSMDLEQRLDEVTLPFLVLHGEADKVTDPSISKALFNSALSFDKEMKLYPGMWHGLTSGEPDGNIQLVFRDIIEWLDKRSKIVCLGERPSVFMVPVESISL